MSKILKSVTLGDVKNGGIFRALGKEFVKLDADEHGCLVLAKEIWTRMPFREGDDPECPNDLRRSEIMPYLGNCLAEFTKNGTPLSTFIPLRIDLQDTTGQNEYGILEVRIGLLTLRGYGKYWRLIPKVDAPWWLATPYGTPNCSPCTINNSCVWYVGADGSIGTVGITGNEAMGRILAGGVRDMADWVNKLYGQAFAAVYVQPGAKVAVHLEEPLTIDYDPAGRRVDHRLGDTTHAQDLD